MITGLYLFQNDLRLDDNPALKLACEEVDQLICLYCLPIQGPNRLPYTVSQFGEHRMRFLLQSLDALKQSLANKGQELVITLLHPLDAIPTLISRYNVTALYRSQHAGYNENRIWSYLETHYPFLTFTTTSSHTLFETSELPFALSDLPTTFSQFRKHIEKHPIQSCLPSITALPQPPKALPVCAELPTVTTITPPVSPNSIHHNFMGGESKALQHLEHYFATQAPSHYKETRNALDDWQSSTKFSPWLALGCLSPRRIIERLQRYHQEVEQNSSTEWILFELLWREYFQWYAHSHQGKLFLFQGIKSCSPNTSFYAERYQRWCAGNTPFPIVNACMKQLNQTGYMSNRGRQLVASCFVHELNLDWRYGAAYFEQHLLDYDVASNWGNWQYLAGVGADPRGHRKFDLAKQTTIYDPDHHFIRKWKGNEHDGKIDTVDAADWPIRD
ncbi:FAD-binding protein [Photobacterium jeanii]|uniref:Cryptochrome DASH n=2 Tax=Photobacterium jeanii TaxID=858640 RepID=A0A178K6Z9_9GAMM|nr:FAD-binding protein [Photobacterium jeanii]PST89210.1 DASH family cryptochrome [Photobacterium jeanii]